jgi:hypothetical protein
MGILAGVVGSAAGAWFWARHRRAAAQAAHEVRERGTVIFRNTPVAAESLGLEA